jgi:hypothetical protein
LPCPTIEETLKRLATTFTVKDIMVPDVDLTIAADDLAAIRVSHDNPHFSVIPIRQNGKPTGYFERDSRNTKNIELNDLISDGTSLLDLVEILEDRQFSFVLSQRQIDGYVHYSDLNHHLVKLAFYVISEALERAALDSIHGRDDRESLKQDLDPARSKQIENAYKRTGDAARSLVSCLNTADLLRLAAKADAIQIEEGVVKFIKDVRDASAHPSDNLISNYSDVKKLADVKRECLRVLGAA